MVSILTRQTRRSVRRRIPRTTRLPPCRRQFHSARRTKPARRDRQRRNRSHRLRRRHALLRRSKNSRLRLVRPTAGQRRPTQTSPDHARRARLPVKCSASKTNPTATTSSPSFSATTQLHKSNFCETSGPKNPSANAAGTFDPFYFELCSSLYSTRRRVLHVLIKPSDHFVKHVLDTLAARVTMRFVRQHHQPRRRAVAFQRLVHSLRLNRKRTRVVVGFAVNHQHRFVDLRVQT